MNISVAMATYNGEKYIEKQLKSILSQSYSVDEIVVSDDGSSDATVEIVKSILDDRIVVVKNESLTGGYCGNFENAIKHCAGDYIFLADQDDIWEYNKVERFLALLQKYPSAKCIFSDGVLIDKDDCKLAGRMNHTVFTERAMEKLDRERWLERAVSQPLSNGMAMCISKELLETAFPFPIMRGFHDHWLIFCAVCLDSCYYINEKLVKYRLHGENTAGNATYKGVLIKRISKTVRKIRSTNLKQTDRVELGNAMKCMLEKENLKDTKAYMTAMRICEIGKKEVEAFQSSRMIGVYKLTKLFCTDMRFRKSGTNDFIYKIIGILFKA